MSESNSAEDAPKVAVPAFNYFTETVHHEPYDKISPLRPELSARGRNVVVTGGGTGIGKAIAIGFAQAGAHSVAILGRREDRLKSAVEEISAACTDTTSTILYEPTDITKREEVDKTFASIVEKVGKIDILVSNAGVLPAPGPIAEYEGDELMRGFTNNVLATFNVVQALLQTSTANPTIINISSGVAHMAPMPGLAGHQITKAACLKMMNSLAAENPHLHVVNVQPGTVATEMSAIVKVKGKDAPELPGQFCVWLASPEAKFLSNKYVWANWDVGEMMARADEVKNSRLLTVLLDGVPM